MWSATPYNTTSREVARQFKAKAEVIQPFQYPWSSTVVMIRKRQLCVDIRWLNKVTKVDTYPLPFDLLDRLKGSYHFLTLDLASWYWQTPVSPGAREETEFAIPLGPYEIIVMPFRLTNAPGKACLSVWSQVEVVPPPLPSNLLFQIVSVDIMDLPKTWSENRL